MNTTELIRKSGHDCEEYDVITEDRYILKMFHILNDNITQDLPIILLHGLMDSSDTFCIRRKYSPAVHLTESGYDVWLGNMRGNRYSRRHVTLDPDVDKEYWDFTFHENGYYDYPAFIDYVLQETGKSQLILIGHSQGTWNYFVMGSTRPEYNQKIKVSIALAPIFYNQHTRGLGALLPKVLPTVYEYFKRTGQVELLNTNSTITRIIQYVCTELKEVSYKLCLDELIFPALGADAEQIEPDFVPKILGQYLSGTSVKIIPHALQFWNDRHYGWFNYGPKGNMVKYNSPSAPLYNLTNISTKVVLMVGKNDYCATVKDSLMLQNALPNATYFLMPWKKFSHIDFIWGSKMSKHFFPYLDKFLNAYK